jgi:precorrin-2 dehydrogenase/sirohydrochlorin ferrochelatase
MSYPVCLILHGRKAVVVGAGKVAHRKIGSLLAVGAGVTVIAPAPCEEVRALALAGAIELQPRRYRRGDLRGAFLAVVATDQEAVNARVSADARKLGIPVNVVDRPELCSFTLPAVARRGNLSFTVSTGGRCPSLARILRDEVEKAFGPEYGVLLDRMGRLRAAMLSLGWETGRVNRALTGLFESGLLRVPPGDGAGLQRLLEDRLGPEFTAAAEGIDAPAR